MLAQVSSSEDLNALLRLRKVVDLVQQEIDPDMPIGYLRTMLELMVAHIDTGHNRIDLTQKDLLERTGIQQSSLSRAVNALDSDYDIADNLPHPMDRRFRHVRLNPKGRAMMGKIIEVLKDGR
jgi:DNA-binding MarR family transcriptional regulator